MIDRSTPAATGQVVVDGVGPVAGDSGSVTIGADGFPLIAYLDFAGFDLRVAHCQNPSCTVATKTPLDSFTSIGGQESIALGKDGLGVISYFDAGPSLDVAHCQDVACPTATVKTINAAGNAGSYNSLAIGSDGLPLVAPGTWAARAR